MPTPAPRASGPGRLRRLREAAGAEGPITRYATPFTWEIDSPITPATPTNTGGAVDGYTITAGALPTGLSIHATTGAISGTPTGDPATGSVDLSAPGPGGAGTIHLEWTTVAPPPP